MMSVAPLPCHDPIRPRVAPAWLWGARCVLRQLLFRMNNCRDGNSDPNLILSINFGAWISARPNIANAIVWELPPPHGSKTYPDWTFFEKRDLHNVCYQILKGWPTNLPEAPPLASTPDPEEGYAKTLLTGDLCAQSVGTIHSPEQKGG